MPTTRSRRGGAPPAQDADSGDLGDDVDMEEPVIQEVTPAAEAEAGSNAAMGEGDGRAGGVGGVSLSRSSTRSDNPSERRLCP